jgi:hypothetical protein
VSPVICPAADDSGKLSCTGRTIVGKYNHAFSRKDCCHCGRAEWRCFAVSLTGENSNMQISQKVRAYVVGFLVILGGVISSAAYADSGTLWLSVVKGGWFVGANGGSGTLVFHGRRYPLSVGGIDAGLVFGLSQTSFYGRVIHIRRPSDVTGVYGAAGAGAALGVGARVLQLANDKGAILQLEGRQIGLIANLDLSGLVLSLR